MKKGFFIVFSLLLVVAFGLNYGKQAEPLAPNLDSSKRLATGPFTVNTLDVVLEDVTRITSANKQYEGSASRKLATTIWYPNKADGQLPLIVHSHGFSSLRQGGEYIARHLASHGYLVMAADFPLTNYNAPGGPLVKDVVNQPRDISFLINSFSRFSKDPQHPLFNKLDKHRIATIGISLGGMASVMAAFDPAKRDTRIKAVISIAGPSSMFAPEYFANADVPMMMVSSNIDALVNYEDNALPILNKTKPAVLVTIANGSHTGFSGSSSLLRWMNNPDEIGCMIVMDKLEGDDEAPWYDEIGSREDGIINDIKPKLCLWDPLPAAMNPLEQQRLTLLAVRSFLDMQFNRAMAEQAKVFLLDTLAKEVPEVLVKANF